VEFGRTIWVILKFFAGLNTSSQRQARNRGDLISLSYTRGEKVKGTKVSRRRGKNQSSRGGELRVKVEPEDDNRREKGKNS